jgi:hypothetical protein
LVAEFERDPKLLLAYGDAVYIDDRGASLGALEAREWDLAAMARSGMQAVPQPASLWSRRAWELAGPFNERAWALFDTEFFLRLATYGPASRVREPLAAFRLHPASKQMSRLQVMAVECVRFADEFFGSRELPVALRPFARAGRASFYRRAALAYEAAGDSGAARRLFLRSLALRPWGMSRKQLRRLLRAFVPVAVIRRRRAPASSEVGR